MTWRQQSTFVQISIHTTSSDITWMAFARTIVEIAGTKFTIVANNRYTIV